jgi:DNA-binding transcriptional ArsR family regulator
LKLSPLKTGKRPASWKLRRADPGWKAVDLPKVMNVPVRRAPHHTDTVGPTLRRNRIRSGIVQYLSENGASKVSDISTALGASRDTVRYHLAALEGASMVRSNISPGMRASCTPFYSLTAAGAPPK